jgi:hypothetical protein
MARGRQRVTKIECANANVVLLFIYFGVIWYCCMRLIVFFASKIEIVGCSFSRRLNFKHISKISTIKL